MTILAIDIGGTAIKYALVDDNNNISSFLKFRLRQSSEQVLCLKRYIR